VARARLDLSERCVHWLEALLRHRPPPARTLELGCANGAFVALLTAAGYQATGLDLSPAVTAFARETFGVPILTGPLEAHELSPGCLDVVILMDVLEHVPDPLGTLRKVAGLLSPDGLVLIQTPRHEAARAHQALVTAQDPFLQQLKPAEHLFLFSPRAVEALLREAGLGQVRFEPAIYSHYDMCLLASPAVIPDVPEEAWRAALRRSRTGRVVEALIDAYDRGVRTAAERAAAEARGGTERTAAEARGGAERTALTARAEAAEALASDRQETIHRLATEVACARAERDALAREKAAVLRRLGPLAGIFQRRIART
jgi:SAM-dependent methyltransferase